MSFTCARLVYQENVHESNNEPHNSIPFVGKPTRAFSIQLAEGNRPSTEDIEIALGDGRNYTRVCERILAQDAGHSVSPIEGN